MSNDHVEYDRIGVFTDHVDAYYNGDGSLRTYSYIATDGSYCVFNRFFELEDVYPPYE